MTSVGAPRKTSNRSRPRRSVPMCLRDRAKVVSSTWHRYLREKSSRQRWLDVIDPAVDLERGAGLGRLPAGDRLVGRDDRPPDRLLRLGQRGELRGRDGARPARGDERAEPARRQAGAGGPGQEGRRLAGSAAAAPALAGMRAWIHAAESSIFCCSPDARSKPHDITVKAIYITLVMLDRDQPLLGLAPRRQEDAAVVLEQPVRVAVGVVDSQEVTEVADRRAAEDDAALRADRDDAGVQPVARRWPRTRRRPLACAGPRFAGKPRA